jgi:endothelin-converting enzyme
MDSLSAVQLQAENHARQILEGPYPSGSEAGWIAVDLTEDQIDADQENFAKIKSAYQACMNYTALEKEGLEPLTTFVKTVVDTFPAAAGPDKAANQSHDYSTAMGNTIALFESLGIESTQRITQVQKPYNPDEIQLSIVPPSIPDIPADDEAILEYLELAATLVSAVHPANITIKQASSLMESMLLWQETVDQARLVATEEEAVASDTSISLAEIQKDAPQLNYEYVVSHLAPKGYKAEKVIISPIGFFKNVSRIISETPSEVIQTFFVWRAISALSPYIESEPTNAYNNFNAKLYGEDPESPLPRWQSCLGFIDNGVSWIDDSPTGLTWILSRFFLEKHYSPGAKNLTSQIIENLETAFLERVETRDWASPEVKKASAEKVRAMANKIAWSTDPDVLDPSLLKEYYSDVEISSSHAVNALALATVNIRKMWASLGKSVSRGRVAMSTLEANAYHDPQLNEIVISAGIQQFPAYDVDFPSYILYGGMGSIVGHEITHGLDNTGRLYDATGNETTWWDKSTIEAFNMKAECFVEQYQKFTITAPNGTRIPVDGELTLDENIADAGGIVSSFAAWKKWDKEMGKAKSLPGLTGFTHEQLFFVKWGQSWCENRSPTEALSALEDEHSPSGARIKLSLDNSADFKKAFNCPEKKPVCELW